MNGNQNPQAGPLTHAAALMERDRDCCSGGQNDLKTRQKNMNLFSFFWGGGSWTLFYDLKLMKTADGCSEHNRYQMKSVLLLFFILFELEYLVRPPFGNSCSSSSLWTATLIFSHVFFAHVAPANNNIKPTWPLWYGHKCVLPLSCHQ